MKAKYLKYAGSKSRILPEIIELITDCSEQYKTSDGKLTRFVEPFFGSGVVGMNIEAHEYIFSDSNMDIINCHRCVIQNPERVIELCEELWVGGYGVYYDVRERFRKHTRGESNFLRAAMFIYLNRFGFNGMVRYNLSGGFNVPVGKSSGKNPPQIPVEEIMSFGNYVALSSLKRNNHDFGKIMTLSATANTTMYCDPPYVNIGNKGEIQYSSDGFTLDDQERLAKAAESSRSKGARVLVSNHDLPVTRELYKNADRIIEIEAFRSISSKGGTRGKVKEIVAIYEN
ncbi:D12 class N6 adenine-specific DNA methyltransferase [Vibrio phage 3.058.O._10N.286.46.B8]|nr:D12 class N6 adenine-specific DNA methyltransferase [Vibrio phage 2.058.O._10N.286.46.B8]AUS03187.1 D12 class N6 adenine-specific DNA methyltransferase [Vibrio phage 3.058.O._10N.286.46.B8]